eukprot:gene3277-13301_t
MATDQPRPKPRALQAARPNDSLLRSDVRVANYQGVTSKASFHLFVNKTDAPVDLYYYYEGGEKHQGTIAPGSNIYTGTFEFHQWTFENACKEIVQAPLSSTQLTFKNACTFEFHQLTFKNACKEIVHATYEFTMEVGERQQGISGRTQES